MKLQFSLATLLVCVTVLAVVSAVCKALPVRIYGSTLKEETVVYDGVSEPVRTRINRDYEISRHAPTPAEFASRLAIWGPPAVAATLGVLWIVRRVKSPNRPPVG